jgi:shikimate kinase
MNTDIILIGPIGAGKSTLAKLLSERLGLPRCPMDDVRWDYYKEIGYDENLARQKGEQSFWKLYEYWKPFEAHAVERLLSEHSNCVVDFGAGHSVYEDDGLFNHIQQILAPYKNIVLLLPSPDQDESVELLNARDEFLRNMTPNINEHFIKHHSNYDLAKFVVYTKGKTPEETCSEILRFVTPR